MTNASTFVIFRGPEPVRLRSTVWASAGLAASAAPVRRKLRLFMALYFASEGVAQSKLNVARRIGGGDVAEIGITDGAARNCELRRVHRIKRVGANFEAMVLVERQSFHETDIEKFGGRAFDNATPAVAKRIKRSCGKRIRIEPFLH